MLLEPIELSQTEVDVVADILSNPAMVKYCRMMLNKQIEIVATGSPEGQDPIEFLRKQARVQGSMDVFATLLSFSFNESE